MIDTATRLRVQQIVLGKIAAGEMFTAFDITVEARKLGIHLRHDEGKEIVHELFQTGVMGASYNRSVIDVGAQVKPFLYHRFDMDPQGYSSRSTSGSATNQPNTQPASNQPPTQGGIVGRILNRIFGTPSPSIPPTPNPTNRPASGQRSPAFSQSTPSPNQGALGAPRNRKPILLNFDASAFLPISRTELVQKAKGISLWGSPWFGRRDLIPPAEDPRTNLIDRGMVTQGIVTPEQLVEIHRIGAEMDRFRPSQVLIQTESQKAGKAAVEAEKQKKLEEKAKKKAEAAERRAKRQADIQYRKSTDILFLGRGVSSRLNDRTSDLEKLRARGLPELSTPAELASALSISVPRLRWLAFHAEVAARTHYVSFDIKKKSGGMRTLSSPHVALATTQKWILREILDRLPTEPAAHGFVSGRNIVSNAMPHVGKDVVLNMDLENFFPSISFERVRALFIRIGYSPSVSTILGLLCTECPRRRATFKGQTYMVATGPRGLPQGACTSPALSNQVVRRLDRRLQGIANRMDLSYTRYADDVTYSGGEELASRVGYVMACIRHIAQDEGFSVNEKKSRVLRSSCQQSVTGLVVNDKATLSREKIRRLRAILHRAKYEGLAAQNREGHPNFRAWVEGSIAFLSMTRPELGQQMRLQLETLSD
jgi:retron-type reverse transcriptase